jgi:hypothetical protein
MKFTNIVTALGINITAFVPATTSTFSTDIVTKNILETSGGLTTADVLDQKIQESNGNNVSNASLFNKQEQIKSTSS